jgi:hypothetical protein
MELHRDLLTVDLRLRDGIGVNACLLFSLGVFRSFLNALPYYREYAAEHLDSVQSTAACYGSKVIA